MDNKLNDAQGVNMKHIGGNVILDLLLFKSKIMNYLK